MPPQDTQPPRFKGVGWSKKKWRAQIYRDGKLLHLGYFNDAEEAARAYDVEAALMGKTLNFPAKTAEPEPETELSRERNARPYSGGTSRFRGVSWCTLSRKWRTQFKLGGKSVSLGTFNDEHDAARAYDAAAAGVGRPLNFPGTMNGVVRFGKIPVKGDHGGGSSSFFRGVHWDDASGKWEALIKIGDMDTHLGFFANEEAAAQAYDQAAWRLGRPVNVVPKAHRGRARGTSNKKRPRSSDYDGVRSASAPRAKVAKSSRAS